MIDLIYEEYPASASQSDVRTARKVPASVAYKIPFSLDESEIVLKAIRASGPGGQNVNKVSTAIHLRFDIAASSLPELIKTRLKALQDRRISREGIVVIKAQQNRTQEKNRTEAITRLVALIDSVVAEQAVRRATRPSFGARLKRLESKSTRGKIKIMRGKISHKSDE
jgi:ribosome-associated protein